VVPDRLLLCPDNTLEEQADYIVQAFQQMHNSGNVWLAFPVQLSTLATKAAARRRSGALQHRGYQRRAAPGFCRRGRHGKTRLIIATAIRAAIYALGKSPPAFFNLLKHKHRLLYIITLILFMLFFTACGGAPTETTPDATQAATAVATATATATLPPPEVDVIVNGTAVPDPTPTRPAGQLFNSPEYGVHLSQWWHVDDVLPRDLAMVQEMGFGWVKQVFAWRDIEGNAKGEFDWYRPDRIVQQANEANLNLLDPHRSSAAVERPGAGRQTNHPKSAAG
jgi:hypothetical protein